MLPDELVRWRGLASQYRPCVLGIVMRKYPQDYAGDDIACPYDVFRWSGHSAVGEEFYRNYRAGKRSTACYSPAARRSITRILGDDLRRRARYQYRLREREESILKPTLLRCGWCGSLHQDEGRNG